MKKILAVLLSLLMLMMSMAVYATETEHVHEECCCGEEVVEVASEIQPRAEICSCGKTMTRGTVKQKAYTYTRSCQHGGTGLYDTIQVYNVYYYYYCSCGQRTNNVYSHNTESLLSCPVS